jgi:pimeloyl-ACP methyl ester carboxylesterase
MTPDFRTIDLGSIKLRAAIQGSGPLVVMVHGFPESWYSWRHQMGPIAEAGFTACAIDVRGYGGSDRPYPVDAYGMEFMVGDVAGVIEQLSPGAPAVVVGHDWGAPIAWTTALTRPDRVRAVAGLSVPHLGTPSVSFKDVFTELFTKQGVFFYQAYFQAEGVAEAELEADTTDTIRRFYYAICGDAPDGSWPLDKPVGAKLLDGLVDPHPFPAWLSEADIAYYAGEFARSGFRGPLNRYRNHDQDFAWLGQFAGRTIDQPALFIGGDRDLVLTMLPGIDLVAGMKSQVTDLRGADILPGCGHWTQQERPAEVNQRLIAWLRGL